MSISTSTQVTLTGGALFKWNWHYSASCRADNTTVFNITAMGDGAIGQRWCYVQLSVPPCSGLWVKEQDCIVV